MSEKYSQKTVDSKIARHRLLNVYKICAALAVIAVIVAVTKYQWKTKIYTDYELKQQVSWSRSEQTKCMELSNSLFTYSKDGMTCTDTKGRVIWNQTYEMQNPMVRTCKNVVAVGEYNGREIYVGNTEEIMGKITATMPIRDFCVASNGVVAAVLDDSAVTGIYLYSVTGEVLAYFKTTMSKSGYPNAIAITEDGKQVAVAYARAENGNLVSSIGFYNFSAVGQNYTDNLVGAYGYADTVIPIVSFMNNDTAVAIANDRIMFFQGKQKPTSTADIFLTNEIQSVYCDKNYLGLVFYNTTGETTYLLQVYDTNGKTVREIPFDMEYTDIKFGADSIVIYNEKECQIYDWDKLQKYEGIFYQNIQCLIQTGKIDKYILVTEDAIQKIELK